MLSRRNRAVNRIPVVATAIVLITAAFLLAFSSDARAANPSIVNTGTGCTGQTAWLVSCATTGHDGDHSGGRRLRVSALVNHDAGNSLASLLTDEWGNSAVIRSVSATRPTIQGGYPRSRADLTFTHNNNNTGLSCSTFTFSGTRRTSDRTMGLRARDSATQTSSTSNSIVKFTAADQCLGPEDYAYIYTWGANNFDNDITPGTSLTFTYTGDDPDTTGDSDFQGINWRLRNLRTGAKGAATVSCPGNGDNASKSVTVNFPDRGAYVVEAELLDGDGCGANQNPGFWFPIGTADVNGSSAPTFDLEATRPQFDGNTTITADNFSDPDSADGGGAQIVEWDLDENTGNGVGGFEATPDVAGAGSTLTSESKTIDTGTTPGLHTIRARVTDNGAMDAADSIRKTRIVSTTYLVDSAPTANGQTVTTQSNAASLPITLTGSDPDGDSLTYSIVDFPDHGQLCSQAPPQSCTNGSGPGRFYVPDGTFAGTDTFTFRTNDGFGRQSAPVTVSINVIPDSRIDSHPDATSGQNTATFEFSSPANSGSILDPVTFECRIDSDLESDFQQNCTSPKLYVGLSDGTHTFDVRARLGSLVDPTPASFDWTVDGTLPETFIDTSPPDPTKLDTAAFTFHSDDPLATFTCRLDNDPAGFTSCMSPKTYTALSEGEHTFQVRATDSFNRTDPIPASYTWDVDLTAPAVSIDSAPADPTNQTAATFEFSSTDLSATFQCRLDSALEAAFTPCNSPQTYGGTVPLSEGSHTFDVRPTDPAGNVGAIVSRTWTIDISVPDTGITTGPPPETGSSVASFDFDSPPQDNADGFECRLDGGDFEECSSPQIYADVPDGSHTFDVRATDAAGNKDASPASHTWLVDTTAPQTSIDSSPQNPTSSEDADFTFSSDDPNATFECKLDGENWESSCASPKHYQDLLSGQHTFRVRAADAVANADPTPATRTWTIDTAGPTTAIDSGPQNPSGSDSASFQFSADDPGATFECRLDSTLEADFQACTSPKNLTGLTDGSHTFEVRAEDALGTDGGPASRTWTVDTSAPDVVIDSRTPSANPTTSSQAAFAFHSTDGTASFQCRLDDGGWQGCSSGKTYTGLDDGQHTFDVKAQDSVSNTSAPATETWTVADSGGPNTTIDSGPADGFATEATFNFSADESSAFECKLDTGAYAACGNGMSGSTSYPDLALGEHTFMVRGTDSDSNTDPSPATWAWTVSAPPSGGAAGQAAQSPAIAAGKGPLKRGRGTVARVSCPTGPCTITGKAKFKIGGRSFSGRVRATSPLASGNVANVTVVLSKAGRAALAAARKGVLKLQLSATSSGGTVAKSIKLKVTK